MQAIHDGARFGGSDAAQIISLWKVDGATSGTATKLWAQVKNLSSVPLPSDASVWFWVDGPGWLANHWVGSESTAALAPNANQWFSFDWIIPGSASSGSYTYWAQVWANTAISEWSVGQAFIVSKSSAPGKATQLSPVGTIFTALPVYTWSAVANSTWYQLWVNDSTSSSGKILKWYIAAEAGCGSGTGNCSVTPSTALAAGAARWWIQAWNDAGFGPWSEGMTFTIGSASPPGKATQVSPMGSISTTTPTYTWNAVTGSSRYLLLVNDSKSSGRINAWYSAEQAGCNSGAQSCSVKPDTALAAGAAQWWIQTWNDSGPGPWSDGMNFAIGDGVIGPHKIEFVTVPAGEFQMGSTNGSGDEKPVHRIIISKPFQLGKYEITQAQWRGVMGNNPSYFTGDDKLPVEQVTWNDVQQFIAKLNAANDGYQYRLPTEAEWEYACRAGTTGDYAGALNETGWYNANSDRKTHPVGTKTPNTWGLYDMHGNVWEWVQDWYASNYYSNSPSTDPSGPSSGSDRVFRGGSWSNNSAYCRSAARYQWFPSFWFYDLGFRLLRTPR